ncbi:hypothetical protein EK21DRAFT_82556 [Setomelanomma holmii]|uniref:Uncharacterized protein n=1 Tax=Setomelanomma holmii TaxID=210430 RepID=A0A9P4LE05_9PLEO|nr:hypothetical protein EK21DRAFT_82556 [Setomelanomma holmii]
MAFQAHDISDDRRSSRSRMANMVRAYSDELVWLYFPLSPDEKICGFWVMRMLGGLATVAIYTSYGRSRIFGPYVNPESHSDVTIKCLNGSRDGYVKAIFYNDLRSKGAERDLRLAISSTQDIKVEVPEHPPWPIGRVPYLCMHTEQPWYYSKASLKGIRSIEICRHNTTLVCFGISIHYDDQSREVLGQWRFDQYIGNLPTGDYPYIHFHVNFSNGNPCVQDIQFEPHRGIDQAGWTSIPMNGCLVWWFSKSGGVVVHEQDMEAD